MLNIISILKGGVKCNYKVSINISWTKYNSKHNVKTEAFSNFIQFSNLNKLYAQNFVTACLEWRKWAWSSGVKT